VDHRRRRHRRHASPGPRKPGGTASLSPPRQETDDMLDVIVRTSSGPQTVAAFVQSAIQSMDKSIARFNITTVEQER
jgi:hypothetical protein